MLVLGFDPGTATTGYGVVEGRGTRLRHVVHGIISTPAGQPFSERLATIFRESRGLLSRYQPDAIALEKVYFARNVTTAISVIQARGVIALAAALASRPIGEFSPLEMKNAVVGYGKATKRQIQEMVKILLNMDQVPKPDDAADALALAICQIHAGRYASVTETQSLRNSR
ncbi:MAG: crossover junction endodeoxyribonuclease RuvC [Candidatus Hydrogenedentes bacterium]|nr:crossover junction endodeoxyribonuclease RuvC [Candidatus Hydrogenedentota bacterium]